MEFTKNALFVGLAIAVAIGIYQYFSVWDDLEEKLEAANNAKSQVEATRDTLNKTIEDLRVQEGIHAQEIISKDAEIATHRREIENLQTRFQTFREGALSLVSEHDIARQFLDVYDFKDPAIAVREYPIFDRVTGKVLVTGEGKAVTEPYLILPIDYVSEVVIMKEKSEVCEQQIGLLGQIDVLQKDKIKLNEAITELERQKSQEFARAYEEAYASFNTIHSNYVALLNAPPKVDLAPKWLQVIGGFVGGVLVCQL